MFGRMIANTTAKAGYAPLFDDPTQYGLEYENVEFQTSDGVTLRGWLIKGNTQKVVIQSHFGIYCSRSGYTNEGKGLLLRGYPQDVPFLRQAKYLNEAGYTVLMYDFRNHGESDTFRDGFITQGADESLDVIAAVRFIANHADYEGADIGLLSICMGFGSTIYAYGRENGLKNHPQIRCIVGAQPLDYVHFLQGIGLPRWIQHGTLSFLEDASNHDFAADSWRPYVRDVNVPTRFFQNTNDGFLDRDFVQGVYEDLPAADKELVWLDLPDQGNKGYNRMANYDWLGTNPEPVLEWFRRYM